MNKYQESLKIMTEYAVCEDYHKHKKILQELVDKNKILMNENIQNLLKSFLPYKEPYCSSCMFYTESDCDTKNKCYLKMLFKILDWGKEDD